MRLISFFFCLTSLWYASAHAQTEGKPTLVASFSILGDITKNIAGEHANVFTLIGPNSDVHSYHPSPADAKLLARANLVIINGLGLEGWMPRLIKTSGYKGNVLEATRTIKPLPAETDEDHHEHEDAHEHGTFDPHAWQDLSNGKKYVETIRDALTALDPPHTRQYQENAALYLEKITALDTLIKKQFATIPTEKRRVVSAHDAFRYFSKAYGIEFLAPLGLSTEHEPSAAEIAQFLNHLRDNHIGALFLENKTNPSLIRQLSKDTHIRIGGTLYPDALSEPTGPAPTYLGLFEHNASELWKAME